MLIQKAFKFRLKPNKSQRIQLAKTAGCVRLVWNKTLAEQQENHAKGGTFCGYSQLNRELALWKKEESLYFLKEVHSQPLQQAQKDLDRAYKDFFKKRKGAPKFKKKSHDKSFRYPQGVKVLDQKVYLPKVGWVKFQKSRAIEGIVKNATVSFHAGHWYVSLQTEFEQEVQERLVNSNSAVIGIDLGVTAFASTSEGELVQPMNSFRKHEKKLAKTQKVMSRRKKGSQRWLKTKYKVQKQHKKIANVRKDFLHKLSTNISKNHAVVVLEDLKVANMSHSAKGSVDEPGKNVKAKSGLNKAILDQGWYEFRRQLEYKQRWSGGKLVLVPPQYTSQRCHACGYTAQENRLEQENFLCTKCGHTAHADINAAQNIKGAGLTLLACGDISSFAS